MRSIALAAAAFAAVLAGSAMPALAQDVPKTVFDNVAAGVPALDFTSPDIAAGKPIDVKFSSYGDSKSPALNWSAGPAGTGAYVVVLQDPIVGRDKPNQHWIIYNIPANVTSLPQDLPKEVSLSAPAGAMQASARNSAGYFGPRPPSGQTHNYVYQVFAIDAPLTLAQADVNTDTLTAAIKGHVLAAGKLEAPFTGP